MSFRALIVVSRLTCVFQKRLYATTPSGLIKGTLIKGNLTASDLPPVIGFVQKIERGETYVNIHTVHYPTGEIRGQISLANITTAPQQ